MLSKIKNKAKIFALTISLQHCPGGPRQWDKGGEVVVVGKILRLGKETLKLSLFTVGIII